MPGKRRKQPGKKPGTMQKLSMSGCHALRGSRYEARDTRTRHAEQNSNGDGVELRYWLAALGKEGHVGSLRYQCDNTRQQVDGNTNETVEVSVEEFEDKFKTKVDSFREINILGACDWVS